jgi:CRISPR-associated protein Csm3
MTEEVRVVYGKLIIKSELKVLTGLHIGGSNIFAAIGSVDSPVIKDTRTNMPIVPGSSLKGKLRTLLARSYAEDIHKLPDPNDDPIEIRRLFGSSGKPIIKGRLQFADAYVCNSEEFQSVGLTEIKFENTIDRGTSMANPRQIERVVSGVRFAVNIVYDLECKEEVKDDLSNLARAMKLLQLDYLGGHGTRGSGRVSFEKIEIIPAEEGYDLNLDELKSIFEEVESYELLSV